MLFSHVISSYFIKELLNNNNNNNINNKNNNNNNNNNAFIQRGKRNRLDFQPFCEPAFLAPHHGRSLEEDNRTPKPAGNRA